MRWIAALALAACGEARGLEDPVGPDPAGMPAEPHTATITKSVGGHLLGPGEETLLCFSWTLANEAPLYVEAVTFANLGSFHHSNWFVVPEDVYDGPDGSWDCAERDFEEVSAALSGAVLFAQSTQAWNETQQLAEGAVIKIPTRSKIVSDVHLLNLAPAERETEAWLTLELVHPWFVRTVLKPMMLSYIDLNIAANARSEFTGVCGGVETGPALPSFELHYALPHYHSTGERFELAFENDASEEIVFQSEGFGAGGVGINFDPPVLSAGFDRMRFTCGYNNWHSQDLKWGIGIDEMCVMFGLVDGDDVLTGVVPNGTMLIDVVDGVRQHEAPCQLLSSPGGVAYNTPRISEVAAPLYVPPQDPNDAEIPPVPECVDVDSAAPAVEPTIGNLRNHVFEPYCTFSACHGDATAGGLFLQADDLEGELRGHTVQSAVTSHPLVSPGDPDGSHLVTLLSRCNPRDDNGNMLAHMPRNAPVLLDAGLVAAVRQWILELPE